jgi:hypothetical protein
MSYDLFVYSEQAGPIAKDALKAELENQGWKIALLSDGVDALLNAEGPLEAYVVVAGWDAADERVADFAALVAQGNVQGLTALAAESEAAVGCGISVTIPYSLSSDCASEEVRELAQAWGPRVRRGPKQSQVALPYRDRSRPGRDGVRFSRAGVASRRRFSRRVGRGPAGRHIRNQDSALSAPTAS